MSSRPQVQAAQLNRGALGGAPSVRLALACSILMAWGCAPTLQQELAKIGPTRAEDPLSLEDTVIALVLLQPAVHRTATYGAGHQVIVASTPGHLTPHAIPAIDSVTFFVLDSATIQRLADKTGDLSFVGIAVPQVRHDTALVGVQHSGALRHIPGRPRAFRGWEWCSYTAVREGNHWALAGHPQCLIS